MNLVFNVPINNLSFGNVAINLLREAYKKGIKASIFPIGNVDVSAFDKLDQDFINWMNNAIQYRYHSLDKEAPTLTLWHLNGAEKHIGPKNYLFTFHELDDVTFEEKKVVQFQEGVFLTNQESVDILKNKGCNNVSKIDVGFDSDFFEMDSILVKDKIHFTLMGKFEKRKHTKEIIQTWLKKFGNNPKYLLSCCVDNPFLEPENMQNLRVSLTQGNHYNNINFVPRLATNTEVNHFLNSSDIDLTGLSGAEGWNLPAFNATALGKWSIVYNHTGHKSWATDKNCILLEPEEKESSDDGLFFKSGGSWNQGKIYGYNEQKVMAAMDKALELVGKKNEEGLKLQKEFTYSKTLDQILNAIR